MRYTRDYIQRESAYCRKEEQDFYNNRTEENRQKVLEKREEFRLLNNLPCNKVICPRCNKEHYCEPVNPERIASKLAEDMAKQIDSEVLEGIKHG